MLKKLPGIAMPLLCLSFFLSNGINAQTNRYGNPEIFTDSQIISINDIVYGSAKNNLNITQALTLDLYLPDTLIDTITALPLVIFVHGGSFKGGDKNSFDDYCEAFAKRGYAAATINYRTGWNKGGGCTGDPLDLNRALYRCLQDINASIRYLSYFHNTYHIDPDQIFLGGESSGAAAILHSVFADKNEIKSLTGTTYLTLGALDSSGNTYHAPYHVKGCMNESGGLFSDELIQSTDDVSVISFHGTEDRTVAFDTGAIFSCYRPVYFKPIFGSLEITNELDSLGFSYELNYLPGGDHKDIVYPKQYIIERTALFFQHIIHNESVQSIQVSGLKTNASAVSDYICRIFNSALVTVTAVEGAQPYLYSSDQINWHTGNVFTAFPGTSTYYAKDATGTIASVTQTIVADTLPETHPSITVSGEAIFCEGDSVVLTADNAATYLWSNGAITQSVSIKTTGEYFVIESDMEGCASASAAITVTVHANPLNTASVSGQTILCEGDSVMITADEADASYLWSGGETTQSVHIKTTGDYSVTVEDINGCKATSIVTPVIVNAKPLHTISVAGALEFCDGDSVTLTADDTDATYLWNTGEITRSIIVKETGEYYLTLESIGGCSAMSTAIPVIVNHKPINTISVSGATTFCEGDSVTLTADEQDAIYLWSTGETTQSINIKSTGDYSFIIESNGCTALSNSTSVSVNAKPLNSISVSGATTFCEGDSVILTADEPEAIYLWSSGQTTQSVKIKSAGTYSLLVEGINGCAINSPEIPVVVNTKPLNSVTVSGALIFCSGNSVELTANAAEANYAWSDGAATKSIIVSSTGNYFVTITGVNGCSATSAPIPVTVNPLASISISAGGATTFCSGESVVLTATYTGTGVHWKRNGMLLPGATATTYTVKQTGIYSCLVTNTCGDLTSNTISVTQNKSPVASVTALGPIIFCPGGNVVLSEEKGNGETYQWYRGTEAIAGATRPLYIALIAGKYKCTVTKTATNCSKTSNAIAVKLTCREGEETEGSDLINVYPNPNNGVFYCTLSETDINARIIIRNMTGEEIYAASAMSNPGEINISEFPSGMYFMILENNGNQKISKIIKE